jgi:large subunit ribosomal protein L29
MKREDIRSLSGDELRARVSELRDEQFRLRFRSATETLDDPLRLRVVRREIARALTVLREQENGAAPSQTSKTAKPAATKSATKKAASKRATKTATAKTATTKTASKRAASKTAR